MEKRNRIGELDFFKGIAIILVVVGHVIQRNWEGALDNHPVYTWIYSFHMPLFFFISGYLINHTFGKKDIGSCLKKKVLALLLPYFVWCYLIAPFVNRESLPSIFYILTDTDSRYWFVYLLFYYSVFYYIGQYIRNGLSGVLGGAFLIISVFAILQYVFPCEISSRGLQFLPLYLLGVVSSTFKLNEKTSLYKEPFLSLAILVFMVTSLKYCQVDISLMSKVCKFLASFSICYIVLYFINGSFISLDNNLVKMIMYIGKNSIVIYLTHFFFIKILPTPIVEDLSPYPFWALILSIIAASVIIPTCLIIGKIAEYFKWINRFVYGRY